MEISLSYLAVPTLTTMKSEYEVIANLPWWHRIEWSNLFYNMLVLGLLIASLTVNALTYANTEPVVSVMKAIKTTSPNNSCKLLQSNLDGRLHTLRRRTVMFVYKAIEFLYGWPQLIFAQGST